MRPEYFFSFVAKVKSTLLLVDFEKNNSDDIMNRIEALIRDFREKGK